MAITLSKRDHILAVALRLFCAEGFHATGVDRVVAEAGVAKMTLYKHFASKDDLIVGCLEHLARTQSEALEAAIAAAPPDPKRRLLAAVVHYASVASSAQFEGCAFQHAAAEYADPTSPVRLAATAPKRALFTRLFELAATAGLKQPEAAAAALLVVIEGVLAVAPFGAVADLAGTTEALAERALASDAC